MGGDNWGKGEGKGGWKGGGGKNWAGQQWGGQWSKPPFGGGGARNFGGMQDFARQFGDMMSFTGYGPDVSVGAGPFLRWWRWVFSWNDGSSPNAAGPTAGP